MWRMVGMGSVVTVSPRDRLADLEQMARSRVERDGVAQFAAATADRLQMVRLRRLRGRLLATPDLDVFYGDRTDGYSYLTVYPPGERAAAVWGEPKGVENPEDYWDSPETS
jgi:hypothetical protein